MIMHYESFLGTHPYYKYEAEKFIKDGKLNLNFPLAKELKKLLEGHDLYVNIIATLEKPKLVIYMNDGFSDTLSEAGVGILSSDVVNFDEDEVANMQEVFEEFLEDLEENGSEELKQEIKKMNLVDINHYIYFSVEKEEHEEE